MINYCKTNYNIMWKDKGLQLVMLPTKESSIFGFLPKIGKEKFNDLRYYGINSSNILDSENQFLYLLSDEEIRERDLYTVELFNIEGNSTGLHVEMCKQKDGSWVNKENVFTERAIASCKKVIASTDPSLNLPKFPNAFIEEYVKRYNSKKSLEVEVDCNEVVWQQSSDRYDDNDVYCNGEKVASFDYKLQEEEMERFTDRLGKQPKVNSDNTISIRFKEEKMYNVSEKELRAILNLGMTIRQDRLNGHCSRSGNEILADWIKENLK